ncbi:protein FAM170A-like [Mustela erminea]|uniref:protein FAM170A-like n=1 Tax=Mustela erminea TaxID=36723 RepID=UPI001386DC15|nr:protein FAM170A-like [Mustela erminea]
MAASSFSPVGHTLELHNQTDQISQNMEILPPEAFPGNSDAGSVLDSLAFIKHENAAVRAFKDAMQNVIEVKSLKKALEENYSKDKKHNDYDYDYDTKFKTTQEGAPHPKSSAVVPPGGEAAEQQSSASQYFSCFSSLSEIIRANEDGKGNTQLLTLQLADDPKPSVSSANTEEETFMNVYYMNVRTKRRVAVFNDEQESLEPPTKFKKEKKKKTFSDLQGAVTPSCTTKEPPTCSASRQTIEEQEKGKEADIPPVPPAAEEYPRAKMPEWLVALDSGFSCMACCQVFPSLEVLQEHVKHGVCKGFSCHTFHLTLTLLKRKKRVEKEKSRQTKNTKNTGI